jgi:hypothetical protein
MDIFFDVSICKVWELSPNTKLTPKTKQKYN